MVRVKKTLYWHSLAEYLLGHGLSPSECGKVVNQIFPNTSVNGRHIGAYKRRLIEQGDLSKTVESNITLSEAYSDADHIVSDEDRFIYRCSIGSDKRTLKCFEYKMTMEGKKDEGDIDTWINNMAI